MLYFEAPHPLPNPPPLRGRGGWGVKQINTFLLECIRIPPKKSSVVCHKSLYFDCHSGLDPESSLLAPLDSCFRRNDRFDATLYVKKCWTHYTSCLNRNWDCSEGTEEDKPSFEQETGGRLISIRILIT